MVALARIEGQRLDRPDAVDRLDEERPALGFGALDSADPLAVERQHHDEPAIIRPHIARTINVMIGLKKNITGRKMKSVGESN